MDNGVSEADVKIAAIDAAKGDRTIVFEMMSGDDSDAVLDYVKIAAGVYGADYIFIDHIQRLAYLAGVDGATSTLTKLASNLAQIAKQMDLGIIIISHVNSDGHTKYARSLEEEAIICISIERDQESTDAEERNTTTFNVTKNRPFGRLGNSGSVFYDVETTIITELVV